MKNVSYVVHDLQTLNVFLDSLQIRTSYDNAKSVLVQVFSSKDDKTWICGITEAVEKALPKAVLVGSTTVGEIAEGRLLTGTTVLALSFFDTALVKPIVLPCLAGDEIKTGQLMSQAINEAGDDIAGVLLLTTPLSINVSSFLNGLSETTQDYLIFGGGAGLYDSTRDSLIFCGKSQLSKGVIAVVFLGADLHISSHTYLGWQPLSKEMIITAVDGMVVKTVDNESAFEVYQRYLGIKNDDDFFSNAMEFPFLIERDGQTIARVPFTVDENGGIEFIADIKVGEKFRIGYGDPETIVQDAKSIQKVMRDFEPNAIFLYTCICRRFLMQNDVNLETQPFQAISPTTGFYTYGEIFGNADKPQLLNSTIVVVGMREGEKGEPSNQSEKTIIDKSIVKMDFDPYANKHSRIISRLLNFITLVTAELEQANRELTKLSEIDKLTQIYNRLKLDAILQREIEKFVRYDIGFSVVLMDIDFFKRVNDNYGHNIGDDVLVSIAQILRENIRKHDVVGRWGGEEFLLILPNTNMEQACIETEKLRAAIDLAVFPIVQHQTCSFGVTDFAANDNVDTLLSRVDNALYEAKNTGRNKVVCKPLI